LSKILPMYYEVDFEDIRPYYDHEINPALQRITASPVFDKILDFIFPDKERNIITDELRNIFTVHDFQMKFMHPLVSTIIKRTSKGLTGSGFDQIDPRTHYLFVSNHRDIVLDSAILQVLLTDHHHDTSEITFGSNLMTDQFVIDLGKVNRMYTVNRGNNKSELFKNSKILSAYIRYSLTEKNVSSWIAQRNGRTKDGDDRTETGLLKMFNISSKKDFYASFEELNIVPVSVSYEFEPCCAMKVNELYVSVDQVYRKKHGEDLKSIIQGITQQKGRIHFSVCQPVNLYLREIEGKTNNEKIARLARKMDMAIFQNYWLWPNNYIAYDILTAGEKYKDKYNSVEKDNFLHYMQKEVSLIEGERHIIDDIFLKIYANPVINYEKATRHEPGD
jgi:hypothetical protein